MKKMFNLCGHCVPKVCAAWVCPCLRLSLPLVLRLRAFLFVFLGAFLGAFLGLCFSVPVRAEIVLFPGLGYTTSSEKSNGSDTSSSKVLNLDGRLGWLSMSSGLYIGGMYKYESGSAEDAKVVGVSVGPSLGFITNSVSIIGTYFMQGSRTETDAGVETQFKRANGYQVDLALLGGVTPELHVGPQLSYRKIKYKQSVVSGVSSDADFEITTIQPTLVLLYRF